MAVDRTFCYSGGGLAVTDNNAIFQLRAGSQPLMVMRMWVSSAITKSPSPLVLTLQSSPALLGRQATNVASRSAGANSTVVLSDSQGTGNDGVLSSFPPPLLTDYCIDGSWSLTLSPQEFIEVPPTHSLQLRHQAPGLSAPWFGVVWKEGR